MTTTTAMKLNSLHEGGEESEAVKELATMMMYSSYEFPKFIENSDVKALRPIKMNQDGKPEEQQEIVDTAIAAVLANDKQIIANCGLVDHKQELRFAGYACNVLPRSYSIMRKTHMRYGTTRMARAICMTIRADDVVTRICKSRPRGEVKAVMEGMKAAMRAIYFYFDNASHTLSDSSEYIVVRPGVGVFFWSHDEPVTVEATDLVFRIQPEGTDALVTPLQKMEQLRSRIVRSIAAHNPFFRIQEFDFDTSRPDFINGRGMGTHMSMYRLLTYSLRGVDAPHPKYNNATIVRGRIETFPQEWADAINDPMGHVFLTVRPAGAVYTITFKDEEGQETKLYPVKLSNIRCVLWDQHITSWIAPESPSQSIYAKNMYGLAMQSDKIVGPCATKEDGAWYYDQEVIDEMDEENGDDDGNQAIPGLALSEKYSVTEKAINALDTISARVRNAFYDPLILKGNNLHICVGNTGNICNHRDAAFIMPPAMSWPSKVRGIDMGTWEGVWGITTPVYHPINDKLVSMTLITRTESITPEGQAGDVVAKLTFSKTIYSMENPQPLIENPIFLKFRP